MKIRPAELRKDWVWVRPLVQRVIDKTGEAWLPEDVYASVQANKSAMWVCDEPPGVLVAYPAKETWTDATVLHVWVVACDDMEALEVESYALLADAAKRIGAAKIVMDSPRPGWQRKGWKVRRYIYERPVWAADQA